MGVQSSDISGEAKVLKISSIPMPLASPWVMAIRSLLSSIGFYFVLYLLVFAAVFSACNLFGGAEKTASGEYVLSSAGSDGGEHAVVG